jgi:hypothetical protein
MNAKAIRLSPRLRWVLTALSVVAIGGGLPTAVWSYNRASIPRLEQYMYGDRRTAMETLPGQLHTACWADICFIAGYGLVLGGFAALFRLWSISAFGRAVANYVLLAVGITVGADFVRDWLLHHTLRYPEDLWWFTVAMVATTIKWCGALLTLGGIPATLGILGRSVTAQFRMHVLPWLRIHILRKPKRSVNHAKWWEDVRADPELPERQPTDPAAPPASWGDWSWVKAYNVPGAKQIIEERNGEPVQAICLSGGGVRSACVAMGAMQVFSQADTIGLVESLWRRSDTGPRLIDTVDYVISVSGGGYTAGARLLAVQPPKTTTFFETPRLSQRFEQGSPEFDHFRRGSSYIAGPPFETLRISQRFEEGSPEFDHFRRGSSYIADSPAELIQALAVVLKNLIGSLLMLFTVPVIIGWVFGYLLALPYFSLAAFVPVPGPKADTNITSTCAHPVPSLAAHPASWWAVAVFALFALVCTMFAIFVEWSFAGAFSETVRKWFVRLARGNAVFGLLVLAVVAGLPGLMRLCWTVDLPTHHNAGAKAAAITSVVGLNYLAAIVAIAWKKRGMLPTGELTKPSWWKRLLPPGVLQLSLMLVTLAVLLLVWLITLGSFAAGIFQQVALHECGAGDQNLPGWWWLVGFVLAVLFLGFADVTSLSLHPFYRRRLAHTFAVRRVQLGAGADAPQAERYSDTEWTWLPGYCRVRTCGPKFIFAAAATLTGEAKPAPGLNAVSYVLSHDYIGGPELGWLKTKQLFDDAPPRLKRDLTVQASIAVSGAAFASAMGRQDKGFEKLLAVSGARLGTWLPNPKFVHKLADAQAGKCVDPKDNDTPWPKLLPTIRGAGYFYRELFGINDDDARLVQVTDGGHYENLGLVEALRRRCRLIFCVDGGGDTPPLLSGLSEAMRLAEYELGVTIALNTKGRYSVDKVAPGSGTPFPEGHALATLNSRLSRGTVAVGRIIYPAAAGLTKNPHGVLIFSKAVLWEGCPEWLLTYAASSDVFPHDPTSDQWFNEAQFAAYTALGRIMGQHAVECAKALKITGLI